jgi:hypothetical protein
MPGNQSGGDFEGDGLGKQRDERKNLVAGGNTVLFKVALQPLPTPNHLH